MPLPMHNWFGIAIVAYLIGATIEGVSTASHLAESVAEIIKDDSEDAAPFSGSAMPPRGWQVFGAIATVTLCGAVFWPCRLLHRSLKTESNEHPSI